MGLEDIFVRLLAELPTTGIFALFLIYMSAHINAIIAMLEGHLQRMNDLLHSCIEKQNLDEERKKLERAIHEFEDKMRSASIGD